MKQELADILVCPVCKQELEISIDEEDDEETITGSLYCRKCDVNYSIVDAIPNLLPPGQND